MSIHSEILKTGLLRITWNFCLERSFSLYSFHFIGIVRRISLLLLRLPKLHGPVEYHWQDKLGRGKEKQPFALFLLILSPFLLSTTFLSCNCIARPARPSDHPISIKCVNLVIGPVYMIQFFLELQVVECSMESLCTSFLPFIHSGLYSLYPNLLKNGHFNSRGLQMF